MASLVARPAPLAVRQRLQPGLFRQRPLLSTLHLLISQPVSNSSVATKGPEKPDSCPVIAPKLCCYPPDTPTHATLWNL